jgi:hypothetical protein
MNPDTGQEDYSAALSDEEPIIKKESFQRAEQLTAAGSCGAEDLGNAGPSAADRIVDLL